MSVLLYLLLSSASPAAPSPAPEVTAKIVKDCDTCPELVQIPAAEEGAAPLLVGRYEVTWSEYLPAIEEAGCPVPERPGGKKIDVSSPAVDDRVAMHSITILAMECYLDWISDKTGHQYRFPTEAEWMYFAAAGATTKYPWGDEIGFNRALVQTNMGKPFFDPAQYKIKGFARQRGTSNTREVGMLDPNSWGIFDVIGNAAEVVNEIEPYYPLILRNGAELRHEKCADDSSGCLYYKVKGSRYIDASKIKDSSKLANVISSSHIGFRVVRE
jgi:formylglycine-generating enzyme required for sulfatase activity|tara:strand:+ start:33377 stop:34189 length:813 start_codon:yes stop_codon:yes gene_type:complete